MIVLRFLVLPHVSIREKFFHFPVFYFAIAPRLHTKVEIISTRIFATKMGARGTNRQVDLDRPAGSLSSRRAVTFCGKLPLPMGPGDAHVRPPHRRRHRRAFPNAPSCPFIPSEDSLPNFGLVSTYPTAATWHDCLIPTFFEE